MRKNADNLLDLFDIQYKQNDERIQNFKCPRRKKASKYLLHVFVDVNRFYSLVESGNDRNKFK